MRHLIIFFFVASNAFIAKGKDFKSIQVEPTSTQTEAIKATGNVTSLLLEKNILWILTQGSFFRWNLNTLRLREIQWSHQPIQLQPQQTASDLVRLSSDRVLVRKGNQFFLVEQKGVSNKKLLPGKRTFYYAGVFDGSIVTMDRSYIHQIDKETFRYKGFIKLPKNRDKPDFYFQNKGQQFIAIGKALFKFDDVTKDWKEIFRSLGEIKGLHKLGDRLAVSSAIGLSVFDSSGMIAQSLPVRGRAKLINARTSEQFHDYLLSNKYLLRYSTSKKQRFDIELKLGRVARVNHFSTNRDYAAGVFDGKVKAFKLPEAAQ